MFQEKARTDADLISGQASAALHIDALEEVLNESLHIRSDLRDRVAHGAQDRVADNTGWDE